VAVAPAGTTEVLGSSDMLKQILINLLKNAIEATRAVVIEIPRR
jgi:signal transduction histidine kinase